MPLPSSADAVQIPRDLFGEIFRPDQQKLEKFRYAQSMTSASKRLPRSCQRSAMSPGRGAAHLPEIASTRIAKAKAASPKLTMKIMPKMVEYHLGSSDIIQSMAEKRYGKAVKHQTGSAEPSAASASACRRRVRSCRSDHVTSKRPRMIQTAKYTTARAIKKGILR